MNAVPSAAPPQRVVITGARGYLGSRLTTAFLSAGWQVLALGRRAPAGPAHPNLQWDSFELSAPGLPAAAEDAAALIHCAYDFAPRHWREIATHNIKGSARTFAAARERRIRRLVLISSMSAFTGCRSLYGRAKLETEKAALDHGAWVLRPGLIYGPAPGGLVRRLLQLTQKWPILPVVAGRQHLVHEGDLADFLTRMLGEERTPPREAIIGAHPTAWSFPDLLAELARLQPRHPGFLPVPWRAAWLALRSLECLGLRPGFRSDSLIGLVHSDPQPDFTLAGQVGFVARPFSAAEIRTR